MTDVADRNATRDLGSVTHIADTFADLMRTFVKVRQSFMQAAEHDVEWSAQIVLRFLRTHGPQRAGAIAEGLQADPSTISRQVAAVIRDGLVERRADPEDGRASLLVLTDRADDVLAEYDRLRTGYFADMLHDWDDADLRSFATMLDRFAVSYRTAGHERAIRAATAARPTSAQAGTPARHQASTRSTDR